MRDGGEVLELSRGVFRRADAPVPDLPDLLALAYRVPAGVVCLLSAASAHELTDEIPVAVQLAVPRGQRPPRIDHPPTEIFRFAAATFKQGVVSVTAAPGEQVPIYGPARTVVDLMRLRHRIGEAVALGALRRYLRRGDARPGELIGLARTLDVLGPVRTALDVASAQ
jgi:predicted transcriptional regulator of viral defense system